jgi:hypothetical protein
MMRGRLLVELLLTPLLTTLDEPTENPPREELDNPEERELVDEETVVELTVVGVANPLMLTDPCLIDEKVIASTLSWLIPK